MKKSLNYAFLGAIAFAGAVSFSACSSSDEIVDNPNYNPETNTVKTQIALNIAPSESHTRMATATVQESGTFRGMTGVNLISFTGIPADEVLAVNGFFPLGDITGITAEASSKVYTKDIPVGTKNFLFYGKASDLDSKTDMAQGKLDYYVGTIGETNFIKPSEIYFSLSPIVTESVLTDGSSKPEDTWLSYLNGISSVSNWSASSSSALRNAYTTFTTFTDGTRQGSAQAILRTVQDLYKAVATIYEAGTLPEADNTIAKAIMDKINQSPVSVTKAGSAADIYTSEATVAFADASADISKFPKNFQVPSGTAALSCSSGTFSYVNTGTNVLGQSLTTAITSICYPAELTYFCNSPLRATDKDKKSTDYEKTVTDWNTEGKWTDWKDSEVKLSTHAVAMRYNVRYGVALLKSTFKVEEGSYYDNAGTITKGEKSNQQIAINGTSFKITGIIINGQPSKSDYQFLKASDGIFNQNVYDLFSEEGTAIGTDGSVTNYTLLMDNYTSEETQQAVTVALELVNNTGSDFYGKTGIIGAGQTFYLLGTLTPEAGDWTETDAGVGYPVSLAKRVFAQDFLTEANFTLKKGKNATDDTGDSFLKDAYSVIPDLRSTQMTFGLSVDLIWKTGLIFNVDI